LGKACWEYIGVGGITLRYI